MYQPWMTEVTGKVVLEKSFVNYELFLFTSSKLLHYVSFTQLVLLGSIV